MLQHRSSLWLIGGASASRDRQASCKKQKDPFILGLIGADNLNYRTYDDVRYRGQNLRQGN